MAGQTAPCVLGAQWPVRTDIWPHPLPGQCLEGGSLSVCNPCGLAAVGVALNGGPGWAPPPVPAPRARTLLEAEMGHPLDGCASLLHELVEADQEGLLLLLLLLPLPACLGGLLGKEHEAVG